jgi:hypothetical protein
MPSCRLMCGSQKLATNTHSIIHLLKSPSAPGLPRTAPIKLQPQQVAQQHKALGLQC